MMPPLENGKGHLPMDSSNIFDFKSRLERIESAVEPLKTINITLEQINETLLKIERVFDKIVEKAFYCIKWLGFGVFIIVLVAMGFKEIGQFIK